MPPRSNIKGDKYVTLMKESIRVGWVCSPEGESVRLRYKIHNNITDVKQLKILNNFRHWYKTVSSGGGNIAVRLQWNNNNSIYIEIIDGDLQGISQKVLDLAILFGYKVKNVK